MLYEFWIGHHPGIWGTITDTTWHAVTLTTGLKLLVDSVQSSIITHKENAVPDQKIEKLASIHSAQLLPTSRYS